MGVKTSTIVLVTAGCIIITTSATATTYANDSVRIVAARPSFYFVGDSITEQGSSVTGGGFVSLLQGEYVRSVDMVNRDLCGYTTRCMHGIESRSGSLGVGTKDRV